MRPPLLSVRAILRHLVVLAVAVGCVTLGQWQLDRLEQVRGINELLDQRMSAPAVPLSQLVPTSDDDPGPPDPAAIEFRRVEVSGVYRPEDEVLQRNREHRTRSGFHLLTPLDLGDGRVLLVRRGWVPATHDDPPVSEALPPRGPVTLTGVLELPVSQPGFGPRDPDQGELARVFHADTERIGHQLDGRLLPVVLRLEEQDPPAPTTHDALPVALDPPVLDEANHLSYAVQWHLFAVIAVIGYVAWSWTSVRSRDRRSLPANR